MGSADLYPFELVGPVRHKLAFVHDIVTKTPLTLPEQIALALPRDTERT
jgi:hypothetical protein